MISYTSNITKSKIQDIRAYIQFGQGEGLGIFVQFEIQSNSTQINVNLIDSNSSNESKNKNSKNPKKHITFGQLKEIGDFWSNHYFMKLIQSIFN